MFKQLVRGDTRSAVNAIAQTNPDFARFLQENQGKSVEQEFLKNGYDLRSTLSALSQIR